MKKILLTLVCVGMVSAPAFAGGCGGCGGNGGSGDDKKKESEKPKTPPTQTLVAAPLL